MCQMSEGGMVTVMKLYNRRKVELKNAPHLSVTFASGVRSQETLIRSCLFSLKNAKISVNIIDCVD